MHTMTMQLFVADKIVKIYSTKILYYIRSLCFWNQIVQKGPR